MTPAPPPFACTVCDSAAGRQTRAGVRDGFAADAVAVGLPLLVLAAAALAVRFWPGGQTWPPTRDPS